METVDEHQSVLDSEGMPEEAAPAPVDEPLDSEAAATEIADSGESAEAAAEAAEPVESEEVAAEAAEPGESEEVAAEAAEPVESAGVAIEAAESGESEEVAAEAAELDQADETAGEEPEEVERPEGTTWYVIHTYSGYEEKVKRNLEQRIDSMGVQDKIFSVIIPTEEEVEIREGNRRISKKRVFPGYILVEMLMTEETWHVVRNTPGVTGFVGMGSRPTPLSQEEVDQILKRMESEAPTIKVGFREGQNVRIISGPFADFMGLVDDLDLERGKVRVLVSFFGRETPVELDFLQVEKV